ncbi:MAG: ABC transporter permease [Thermoanaerobaculia bacterium]|nr:ABC transporter permease [Thermoanaerobaculia bacterium]
MLTSYLTIALRNLAKRKGFTLLNIFGLALGMACCLFILQYVRYERSYDRFHVNAGDIYRLRLDAYQEGQLAWRSATVYPAFAPTMKRDFPEVLDACRLIDAERIMHNPETNVKFAEKKGYFADQAFLNMFSLDLISGDAGTALSGPDKILVSESMAKRYFGRTDVQGKNLVVKDPNFFQTYEISGVFRDYPAHSHLIIDYLISYATFSKLVTQTWRDTTNATETSWGWYDFYTYLQLKPGVDPDAFLAKFPAFTDKYINARYQERKINFRNEVDIIPMPDIHLYSNVNQEAEVNGDGRAVAILFIVALFILAIAWINYVNLSTSRSLERGREVGVRKVLGAMRGQLVRQFLTESVLLNLAAFALALATVVLLMPAFNQFAGKDIPLNFLTDPRFWLMAGAVLALGSLLAGLYPAFVLSAFRPVAVLKGQLKNAASGTMLRKGLIVFQFAASIALIAGTLVVYNQIRFMRNQPLGLDIHQTLVVEGAQSVLDSLYMGSFEPFRNQVLRAPRVKSITASSNVPGNETYWTNGARLLGDGGEELRAHTLYNLGIDETFLEAYQIKLAAGRPFSKASGDDTRNRTVLLNETAVRTFGIPKPEEALNRRLARGNDTLSIVGVVRDFHQEGLQKAINPVAFLFRPDSRGFYSFKIENGDIQETVAAIKSAWDGQFPNDPFHYFFLDESFNKQYEADIRFGRVFSLFAVLAILVACLGLLGLAGYQIVQRTKEIGIRKVLGASATSIVGWLSRDFVLLLLLAIAIATPLAWYFMEQWLTHFAYRINIGWWVFLAAGLAAVTVAFLTVGIQGMRAALANPVRALRSE